VVARLTTDGDPSGSSFGRQFLQAIEEASARLALVIDRLLEVSALAGEDVRLACASVDLVSIVREALEAAGARLHAAPDPVPALRLLAPGVSLDRLPAVWGDARHLREVLDHILENAIKYSPDGGHIDLMLRRARAATVATAQQTGVLTAGASDDQVTPIPPMLELQVRDTGIGIPPEHLERIFDRFHRVDTRLTRSVDGLGLGLAICQRLVELHGGAIRAESDLGRGSTVYLLLPIAAQP
jgi:signal transduction histidine kinase